MHTVARLVYALSLRDNVERKYWLKKAVDGEGDKEGDKEGNTDGKGPVMSAGVSRAWVELGKVYLAEKDTVRAKEAFGRAAEGGEQDGFFYKALTELPFPQVPPPEEPGLEDEGDDDIRLDPAKDAAYTSGKKAEVTKSTRNAKAKSKTQPPPPPPTPPPAPTAVPEEQTPTPPPAAIDETLFLTPLLTSASSGNTYAMYLLGLYYIYYAPPPTLDPALGKEWMMLSAHAGEVGAMREMGALLRREGKLGLCSDWQEAVLRKLDSLKREREREEMGRRLDGLKRDIKGKEGEGEGKRGSRFF